MSKGLGSRHAKLAVGAASTLAVFLLETHNERSV
ncbi:MAG: abortive infection family protein [Cyanobacteria bacterium J06638_22]